MVTSRILRLAVSAVCLLATCHHRNVLAAKGTSYKQFHFPEYKIEAFSPRGLRVSIADVEGLQLFAFHGNVNRPVDSNEAGELSKDIVRKTTGGRWTYENQHVKLRDGDTLYFWLYAIHNSNGYRYDDQSYVVNELLPQPEFWSRNRLKPSRTTTSTTASTRPLATADCDKCKIPPSVSACATPASTAPLIPATSGASSNAVADAIVSIWADSLNNATDEKLFLLRKLDYLQTTNEHIARVLQLRYHPALRTLVMSGRLPPGQDVDDFVTNLLRDKLLLRHEKVVSARRNTNRNIEFEMESYEAKLNVLYAAKDKMKFSPISIQDPMLIE